MSYFEIYKMKNGWFLGHIHQRKPKHFCPFRTKKEAKAKFQQLMEIPFYKDSYLLGASTG